MTTSTSSHTEPTPLVCTTARGYHVPEAISISIKDVVEYLLDQATDDTIVGLCGDSSSNLITNTVLWKYGDAIWDNGVRVAYMRDAQCIHRAPSPPAWAPIEVDVWTTEQDEHEEFAATYALPLPQAALLDSLVERFDQLGAPGHPVTREQALALVLPPTTPPAFTIAHVRAWVTKQPEGAIVGRCGRARYCLIANALHDLYGHFFDEIEVYYTFQPEHDNMRVTVNARMPRHTELPDARRKYSYYYGGANGAQLAAVAASFDEVGANGYDVSRGEALRILNTIPSQPQITNDMRKPEQQADQPE